MKAYEGKIPFPCRVIIIRIFFRLVDDYVEIELPHLSTSSLTEFPLPTLDNHWCTSKHLLLYVTNIFIQRIVIVVTSMFISLYSRIYCGEQIYKNDKAKMW